VWSVKTTKVRSCRLFEDGLSCTRIERTADPSARVDVIGNQINVVRLTLRAGETTRELDRTYEMTYVTKEVVDMSILSASDARSNLPRLIDQTNESHEPVIISGKRNNAVLIAEEDWKSIQETLFLVSIPGMRDSIVSGMKETLTDSTRDLDW